MAQHCAQAAPTFSPRTLLFIAGVAGAAALLWYFGRTHLAQLHARAGEFHGGIVFLALMVLPLAGFPVSVLHALAGAKFGWPLGLALVTVSIAFQLVASYFIVRAAPGFFARRFAWLRGHLSGTATAHRSLTLFAMLLPGAPYFAQNYVVAGAGVPFGIYFGYSFIIHVVRSVVGVVFGEWSGDLTAGRAALFAIYTVAITLACGLAFRRLRSQWRSQQ